MVESTFQLTRGVGPLRERRLWESGVAHWRDFRPVKKADDRIACAIDDATAALAVRDAELLAALVPSREHWRLFATFEDEAAYLDIETSDDVVGHAGISAIGILDRRGPRLFLAGRDLERFPAYARDWPLLVTFNGLSFDVPILRRAFPEWQPPPVHVDLRHVLRRLGHEGGLKSIERKLVSLALRRPEHLAGVDGSDTGWLFRRGRDGDRASLRRFAEYNLYDTVNLRTLMAYAYNQLLEGEPILRDVHRTLTVPGRGDVLYDVSKILLDL